MSFKDAMLEAARLSAQRQGDQLFGDQKENLEVEKLAKEMLTTLGILDADHTERLPVANEHSDNGLKRKSVSLFLEGVFSIPVELKITYSKESGSYKPESIGYTTEVLREEYRHLWPSPIPLDKNFDRDEVLVALYEAWFSILNYRFSVFKDKAQSVLNNNEVYWAPGVLEKVQQILTFKKKLVE